MMYIWAILRNDLACYWKDRPALFWTFAGPLVCAALFGYLTQPKAGPPPAVILIDEGAGADVTRQCAGTLTAKGRQVRIETHIEQDNWNVELKRDDTGVIFRLNGRETELDDERLLRFELESALVKISLPQISAPVQVRQLEPDRATPSGSIVRGFQRSIPAYLLMFLTLNLLVSGANLAEDRQSGRLRRLLHSPIGVPRLIAGKLASRLLVALAQITLLLLLGRMAFGISLGDRPGMTILLLCLYTLAIGSSGVLLGALIHDPDQAQATAVWISILVAPLSGLWWPIETMAGPVQTLAAFLPPGRTMAALNGLLLGGADLSPVWATCLLLTALFVVSFSVSSARLRA